MREGAFHSREACVIDSVSRGRELDDKLLWDIEEDFSTIFSKKTCRRDFELREGSLIYLKAVPSMCPALLVNPFAFPQPSVTPALQTQARQLIAKQIPSLGRADSLSFSIMRGRRMMNYPLLTLIRIAFAAYLICAGLLVIVKIVCFSTPATDPDLLAQLIIHPASGMLLGSAGHHEGIET